MTSTGTSLQEVTMTTSMLPMFLPQGAVVTPIMRAIGPRPPRALGMDNTEENTRTGVLRITTTRPLHIMRARTIGMVTGTLALRCQGDLIIAPHGPICPLLRPGPIIITGTITTIATLDLGMIMIIPDYLQGALPLVIIIVKRPTETITLQTILHQTLVLLVHPLKDHPLSLSLAEEEEEEEVIFLLDIPLRPHTADRFIPNQYLRQGMTIT